MASKTDGDRAAILFRLVASCKANQVEPFASILMSNVDLQQFFAREAHSNSFVLHHFTTETFVEPDGQSTLEFVVSTKKKPGLRRETGFR